MQYKFRVEDGQILTPGVDFEATVTLRWSDQPYQIWHVPARTIWSDRLSGTRHKPAEYILIEVTQEAGADGFLKGEMVAEMRPGYRWKRGLAALKSYALKLKAGEDTFESLQALKEFEE